MTLSASDFGAFHAAVHGGKLPFAWQQRLLEQIVQAREWPRVLDLPTGAGTTTCIDIALFALALDAASEPAGRWCPRRIAMVVDRRIVVDQVAERGRTILRALTSSTDAVVAEVAARLRSLSRLAEEPIGVFTLRGGMPKDDGWARAPDQPLVIASTVDQIGSRMLMQGYGVSQGMKPLHAGLLANDTLLLLDEVHLSEPFRQTLDQLARLRTRFAGSGLRTRFAHAFLSATPGTDATKRFALLDEEKDPAAPLGARLHACKPARLVEVEDRAALQQSCVDHAMDLLQRHRTVAVIVNRVASAGAIANKLEEILGDGTKVALLTGRMRPLDRDDVMRELRPAVQTGRERREDTPKRVIVGTQCIEAGADFDFDALVTEAASLDSLRQRFGRLDRLGSYGKAEGIIVSDKSAKEDPVYGKAIAATVKWFKDQAKERPRKAKDDIKRIRDAARNLKGATREEAEAQIARLSMVDFGVLALDVPTGDELNELLAPKPSAQTLLPAYMDLWAQTSPAPSQVPDPSLWLHGPDSGPPDVQIIWRADLTEGVLRRGDTDIAAAIVAAVRPASLEAISLPFVAAKAWLADLEVSDFSDAESEVSGESDTSRAPDRLALRWRGDESEIISALPRFGPSLKPGDTIIVPASYGGIRRGCFDATATEPVLDCAERSELLARARPVLRLNATVLDGLGLRIPKDEPEDARIALGQLADSESLPAWQRLWASMLAKGTGSLVVPGREPWTVIDARRVSLSALRAVFAPQETLENGVELTTDADDSYFSGRSVSLAMHSADVEAFAREFAARCGLEPWLVEHIALAAWLHDVGKADRRFQLMLRGGSEIEFFKDETPLAKSALPPGARAAQRLAQRKSGYPQGTRHEVQSLAMIDGQLPALRQRLMRSQSHQEPDLDLVLHLVCSHHGYCRPFAPVALDKTPVDVSLSGHKSDTFGVVDFDATTSDHKLHRLDSPLAERFWSLIARYGWQELCWLEAILRLADHRASEEEQSR